MFNFIYNKNQLNWTTRTQVMINLAQAVHFHRHTRQHNIYSVYTFLKPELDFDQNYKGLVDILNFP